MKTLLTSVFALCALTSFAVAEPVSVKADTAGPKPLSNAQLDMVRAGGVETVLTILHNVTFGATTATINSGNTGHGINSGDPHSTTNLPNTLLNVIFFNPGP